MISIIVAREHAPRVAAILDASIHPHRAGRCVVHARTDRAEVERVVPAELLVGASFFENALEALRAA